MRFELLFVVLGATTPLCGQIGITTSVRATTALALAAGPNQRTIPAATDLSNGFALAVLGIGPEVAALATTSLRCDSSPQKLAWTLGASSHGGFQWKGISYEPAQVGQHTVAFEFRSPTRMHAFLDVVYTGCGHGLSTGRSQLDVSVSGAGAFTYFGTCPTSPLTRRYPIVLDATPTVVQVSQWTFAEGNAAGQALSSSTCSLEIVPDESYPYTVTPYGTECNATENPSVLTSSDLRFPGTVRIRYRSAFAIFQAWVVLGDQRTNLVLGGGCTLYDNAVIALPMTVLGGYEQESYLPALPIPGAHVYVQVACVKAAYGLELSRGFDLTAR